MNPRLSCGGLTYFHIYVNYVIDGTKEMKMKDVKVGMKHSTKFPSIVIVEELTPRGGFKYIHEPISLKIGYNSGVCRGSEHFGIDGEAMYEEFKEK
jgi:hypothetical protein